MPYVSTYVEPKLALEHNGMAIYHAYKNDRPSDPLRYWFALYPEGPAVENHTEFDIRTLKAWQQVRQLIDQDWDVNIEAVLRAAIDAGEISDGEVPQ